MNASRDVLAMIGQVPFTPSSSPAEAPAVPRWGRPLLAVRDLRISVSSRSGVIRAVDGVSLGIEVGEMVTLVGESGSGKTMTANSIVSLLPRPAARILGGSIQFEGRDLLALPESQRRLILRHDIAFVVQSSLSSLNPTSTVERQLVDMIAFRNDCSREEAKRAALHWLDEVGISATDRVMATFPHKLSGGMRQRVLIAMAINSRPKLIIADEPTTALDTATQKQVLNLFRRINAEYGTAILLITHDFGVVSYLSQRVAVMRHGVIVEMGDTSRILSNPSHPYTRCLIDSVPRFDHPLPLGVLSEEPEEGPLRSASARA